MAKEKAKKETVTWVKPTGAEVELNELPETIAQAVVLGWTPKSSNDAKRYGLVKKESTSKKEVSGKKEAKEDKVGE